MAKHLSTTTPRKDVHSALRPSNSGESQLRILLAPLEIAGQMQLFVESLRKRGHLAEAVSYQSQGYHGHRNDYNLGLDGQHGRISKLYGKISFTINAARKYDVFHFFYGRSLIPYYLDLPLLKRLGKKIFVHFRGSDIRQRKYLFNVVERRLQSLPPLEDTPVSSKKQLHMIDTWRKYADCLLLANPDMLRIVPEGILVQQAVNLLDWDFSPEVPGVYPNEIVVAHAASNRNVKGTRFVIDAVEKLKTQGLPVRLLLIENTPHYEMKKLFKSCHIGVDQLTVGVPANVSIELMASGKPVIANLDPWYMQHRPDIPVVDANPPNLAEKLRVLVENQQLRIELGHRGKKYVERWHDVERITDQLIDIYNAA